MRAILASILLVSTPALAEQNIADVPPSVFSPTLMQGWQSQPPALTPEQLAWKWAEEPTIDQAQKLQPPWRALAGQRRSTVGQATR